jgi:hypothetical protein
MPADIITNNDDGICGAVVNWTEPIATDNCGPVNVIQTSGLTSGSTFPIGTTTIAYTVLDSAGNQDTTSFTVTVRNTTPVLTSISVPATSIATNAPATVTAQFDDNNVVSASINWGDGVSSSAGHFGSNAVGRSSLCYCWNVHSQRNSDGCLQCITFSYQHQQTYCTRCSCRFNYRKWLVQFSPRSICL